MRKNSVVKASIELEQLYLGVPDESVNLTFQDLPQVKNNESDKKDPTITVLQPFSANEYGSNGNPHTQPPKPISSNPPSPLAKLPSVDFSKGLQAQSSHHHHEDFEHGNTDGTAQHSGHGHDYFCHASGQQASPRLRAVVADHAHHSYSGYSTALDDISGKSLGSQLPERDQRAPRRRRPGIPHSNICTICSNYIYIFRTRCLVCGRVYCRDCVDMGMGEMTEGRKCVECLGFRFSQRYIGKAGNVGCCSWRYPSTVKLAELKWAEKGPRRSGDRGRSGYGPISPITPTSFAGHEPSFVMSATYSPYSPHAHHLPL
ncbi:hypothetical protein L6164_037741 [Bauhinia variegata]|uniref:Uncharacterized protein n=1 Tax=Bauhinia variegata TaxID=167791 RepID=A0ACB9KLR5_BAUVA|nr:hypothetical protein L6164_037741 [Bauhinia variegata]